MADMTKNSTASSKVAKVFIYLILGLLAVTIIVPVAWVFVASIKENSEFYGSPWALPKGFHFQNFTDAWETANMGSYMLNSVFVTVLGILLLIVIALPAAYVLSRFKFKSQKIWNVMFMAGLFINVNYIVVPIFLMLNNADGKLRQWFGEPFFLNNLFILALVYASTALPFTIYLLSGYFKSLAKDYEEAAYVDGAGYWRTMIQVIMPMAKPSIVTVILFNFLAFWNEYIISMTLLTRPEINPSGRTYESDGSPEISSSVRTDVCGTGYCYDPYTDFIYLCTEETDTGYDSWRSERLISVRNRR